MPGRRKNEGEGVTFSVTVPAGLYEFLTRHARRAIIGKNQGEVAVYLMTQQAIACDRESFLGVQLPQESQTAPQEGRPK
jgi:hypothetical protein